MASEWKCNSVGGEGYSCKFVDESQLDGLFKCRICTLALRDPHITECCGENACHLCIVKAVENGGPCPIPGCRSRSVKINLNRDLRSTILESAVYCQSKEAGCEWVGKLSELSKHLKEECPFVEEECPHNCGMHVQHRSIKDHEKECECFPTECDKCGEVYEQHHHSVHVKACPFTVVKCPFCIVGCEYEVQNKDLQQHFIESVSKHSALVTKQSHEVQAEIQDTKLIAKQRRQKLDCHVTGVDTISEELVRAQERITKLRRKLIDAKHQHEGLKQRHERMKVELLSQVHQKSINFQAITDDLERLMVESRVKCYGPALPKLYLSEIFSRPVQNPVTTDESVPPVTFMIPNFDTERKNDARIYLPPFYTHRGGYKLCMIVCCNGSRNVKDEWLSVYAYTLKGQYDTYLRWPLACTIHFQIKTTRGSSYPDSTCVISESRVLDECGFRNSAVQNPYILELDCLKRLPDGCLLMQIDSVKLGKYKLP